MNCTTCGYALWNLRTRQCPECGERFAPSQFEFVLNSVAFCCPHCDQHYYGTGESGHLIPREFHCVKCGELVNMDLMVMRPAEGVRERETQVDRLPWLDDRKKWLKRFFATLGMSLVLPNKLGQAMEPEQPVLPAWAFAAIVQALMVGLMVGPILVFMFIMDVLARQGGPGAARMTLGFLGFAAGYWAVLMIMLALWGLIAHALLRVTGPTHLGLGRTCECVCYASGAHITAGVPCVGLYFGWLWGGVWWAISAIFLLKEGQRVSTLRAVIAGLVPPVLFLALLTGAIYFFVVGFFQAFGNFAMTPPVTPPTASVDARTATNNLASNLSAAFMSDAPEHAATLIETGFASEQMFIINSTATTLDDIPLPGDGGLRLSDLATAAADQRAAAFADADSGLPRNVVAHRVGDFVFTYHGTDMRTGALDGQIWLLIASPDPDSNEAESFDGVLYIGTAWGAVQSILEGRFDEELAEQNRLRAERGLAPLPHPREVTHTQPAVGNPEGSPRRRRSSP